MRRPRRFALATGTLLALGIGLLAVDTVWGVEALGVFPVRVTGRFVDDATGRPIEGVSVVTLPEAADAEHPNWVSEQKQRQPLPTPMNTPAAAGASGPDGDVDLRVDVWWCRHRGPITNLFGSSPLPRYYGVSALLVEKGGYVRTVVDCTEGRWTVHERKRPEELHATLDLGEIRMNRAP